MEVLLLGGMEDMLRSYEWRIYIFDPIEEVFLYDNESFIMELYYDEQC